MKNKNKILLCFLLSTMGVSALLADDLYVRPDGAAGAYATLQAAVDAARPTGDVIHVAEGVYDAFTTREGFGNVCLRIENKSVTLIAEGERGKTVIKGRRSSGSEHGMGVNSVRGIVAVSAGETLIQGFTFQDCTTVNDSSNQQGGAFYDSTGTSSGVKLVDCDFYACSATRGGAGYGGNFIRCRMTGCMSTAFGAALRAANVYESLIYGNKASGEFGILTYCGDIVNCTIAFNDGIPFGTGTDKLIRNCVIVGNTAWKDFAKYFMHCANDVGSTANNSVEITADDLFSPASGDWRLKTGSKAIGAGNATYPARAPEGYRETDFLGNPRATSGKVNCGAVQGDATPVETGAAFASTELIYGGMSVNGSRLYLPRPLPFRVESLPANVEVGFVATEGNGFIAVTNSLAAADDLWPMMDDVVRFRLTEPRDIIYGAVGRGVTHVSPEGDDTTGTGTEANPYATISKAASLEGYARLVLVHPGVYDQGVKDNNGATRVVASVPSGRLMRIKAAEGPGTTCIVGASSPEPDEYGLGEGAVRCASLSGRVALQGFTLRGGRTYAASASSSLRRRGGGVLMNDSLSAVLDCEIKDCVGVFGAAVMGYGNGTGYGHVIRTKITDCAVPAFADEAVSIVYCANLHSSLIAGNVIPESASKSAVLGQNCIARNCTVADNTVPKGYGSVSSHRNSAFVNSIASGTVGGVDLPYGMTNPDYIARHSLVGTSTKDIGLYEACVIESLTFRGAGDYRPLITSRATTTGSTADVSDRSLFDVNGVAFDLSAEDGAMMAGCFAQTVHGGEWYVDAVNGDDANDGATWGTALKTIAAAGEQALPGDVITVAPGTYDEGTDLQREDEADPNQGSGGRTWGGSSIRARAVAHRGVTIVSRDGPSVTIIRGASATPDQQAGQADVSFGGGSNAVRCVYLAQNARIKGFTLVGGRTRLGDDLGLSSHDNAMGGGVYAYDATGLVEDCCVTDCISVRGGAGYGGVWRNCRIENCSALFKRVVQAAEVTDCLFANNTGDRTVECDRVERTTFLEQKGLSDGALYSASASAIARNCAFAVPISFAGILDHCAFRDGVGNSDRSASEIACITGTLDFDEAGVPLKGRNVGIDAGSNGTLAGDALDLRGGQRIYNNILDIGACEYDVRSDYATLMGSRRLTIDTVSAWARSREGEVILLNGLLASTIRMSRGVHIEFACGVAGNGKLEIYLDGKFHRSLTSGETATIILSEKDLPEGRLSFAYVPAASDDDGAWIRHFLITNGFVMSLR